MEIDLEYQHAQKFKSKYLRPLPFVIRTDSLQIDIKTKQNKKLYPIFNNNCIKRFIPSNKNISKMDIYMHIGICSFFWILIPIIELIDNGGIDMIVFAFIIPLGLPFPFMAYRSFKQYNIAPEQTFVTFDRLNSLLTMPTSDEQSYFTIPFSHLIAGEAVTGTKHTYGGKFLAFINDTKPVMFRPWRPDDYISLNYAATTPKEIWSYYVWYMDKNRPLPECEAFDEFREKDFERRKLAGFPPPLFKSRVPTPEASLEQQLLRETFWKDEDYMATKNEAFHSIFFKRPKEK